MGSLKDSNDFKENKTSGSFQRDVCDIWEKNLDLFTDYPFQKQFL